MAGPSRFGAIVIVMVLSCVVLGAVWGLVIYLLPQSDSLPELPSPSLSMPQSAPLSSPSMSLNVPASPDPSVPPVMLKEEAPTAHPAPVGRPASEAMRRPFGMEVKCDMEMDTLCPEEEGERRVCLQRKAAQLSIPCQPILRERLVRMKENMQHLRVACEADRKQFCRDVPLGGGAIVQCLESHAQEVSDHCFQFLPKRGRLLN
ncbi:MAG: hypothetical protein HY348_16420 [Nitrospira defluvii]|nr:hypothetical protein [Nitrospira defluvii]